MDTHRLLASRLISAVIVAFLVGRALEPVWPWSWLAALIAAEALARLATRRFKPGFAGHAGPAPGLRDGRPAVNLIWGWLAAMLWLSPDDTLKLAAVGVWVGQIVFTQNYRHQPWPLVAVSAVVPLASLLIFPFFFYHAHGLGPETARWGLLLLVLNTISHHDLQPRRRPADGRADPRPARGARAGPGSPAPSRPSSPSPATSCARR
jgi:hypothetical protein